MFRAPATFGQQTPGCKYRQNQCYTLDASDLLVVDYDQHDTFTHFKRKVSLYDLDSELIFLLAISTANQRASNEHQLESSPEL